MNKGIVCRVCAHNKDGKCGRGYTEPANKVDECWAYRNKKDDGAMVTHSPADVSRQF